MSLSEFSLIKKYFENWEFSHKAEGRLSGIGDDCALMDILPGHQLAVSMDTLVENVHFPASADACLVGYRALAVNLSDLAAMGARPLSFTLALTLPKADEPWLEKFSAGLKSCASVFQCPLIGGDTTKGPLSITIQVHGEVETGKAITRFKAAPGDSIYVSGSLGLAAYALQVIQENRNMSQREQDNAWRDEAFYKPIPRVELGLAAAGIASAGIDISDGLLADLGHICTASEVGAELLLPSIPIDGLVSESLTQAEALEMALTGGDDYELLLTVSPDQEPVFLAAAEKMEHVVHKIGLINDSGIIRCLDAEGKNVEFSGSGYQHFGSVHE